MGSTEYDRIFDSRSTSVRIIELSELEFFQMSYKITRSTRPPSLYY